MTVNNMKWLASSKLKEKVQEHRKCGSIGLNISK